MLNSLEVEHPLLLLSDPCICTQGLSLLNKFIALQPFKEQSEVMLLCGIEFEDLVIAYL
ncbi:MAG TPA: hypothetical protein VMS35_08050 [Nitrososphaeraceae archaeon]|nr:hypothetical protein [Nitrososphaeraceae archaeon]